MSENTNRLSNGSTQNVTLGTTGSGTNSEQVVAEAIITFALQLPSVVQSSIRWGVVSITCIVLAVSVVANFLMYQKISEMNTTVESLRSDIQSIHEIYKKMDDRHQRLIQYAKEQDYRILTKESRK